MSQRLNAKAGVKVTDEISKWPSTFWFQSQKPLCFNPFEKPPSFSPWKIHFLISGISTHEDRLRSKLERPSSFNHWIEFKSFGSSSGTNMDRPLWPETVQFQALKILIFNFRVDPTLGRRESKKRNWLFSLILLWTSTKCLCTNPTEK